MEGQKKGLKSRPTAADVDDGRTQRSLTVRGGERERTSSSRRTSRVLYCYVCMYACASLAALDVMCVVDVSLPLGVLDENQNRDLAAVSTSGNSLAEDFVLETG